MEWAKPITIGDDVWIGGNVTILPGVTIGHRCTIGAGSVVTKDIPADSIAVGNPCHVIKKTSVKEMKSVAIDERFQAEVQQVVCAIPPGWVLTYGHIARLIGHPQHARQVGLVLKKIGEAQAPCHRVVNSRGDCTMWDEQGALLAPRRCNV